jgi:hypothetical protein
LPDGPEQGRLKLKLDADETRGASSANAVRLPSTEKAPASKILTAPF